MTKKLKSRWRPKCTTKTKLNADLLIEDTKFAEKSTAFLKLRPIHDTSPEAISNRLIESFTEAASEVLPNQNRRN